MKNRILLQTVLAMGLSTFVFAQGYKDNFNRTGILAGSGTSTEDYPWVVTNPDGATLASCTATNNQLVISGEKYAYGVHYVNYNLDKVRKYTVSFDLKIKSHTFPADIVVFYLRGRSASNIMWYGYRMSSYNNGGNTGIYGQYQTPSNSGNLGSSMFSPDQQIHVTLQVDGNRSTLTVGSTTYDTYTEISGYNDGIADYVTFGAYFGETLNNAFVMDNLEVIIPWDDDPGFWTLADHFNRADGNLAGSTTSTGNYPWVVTGSGNYTINNNRLVVSGTTYAYDTFYPACNLDQYESYRISFDLTVKSHTADPDTICFYIRGRSDPATMWYGYHLSYNRNTGGIMVYHCNPNLTVLGYNLFPPDQPTRIILEVTGNRSKMIIGSTEYVVADDEINDYLDDAADYVTFGSYFGSTLNEAFVVDNLSVSVPWESQVGRGHRILIQNGLQIEGITFPGYCGGGVTPSVFTDSKLTTVNIWEEHIYPTFTWVSSTNLPWSSTYTEFDDPPLESQELPYLSRLIRMQYLDEYFPPRSANGRLTNYIYLTQQTVLDMLRDLFVQNRIRYPNVMNNTNQWDTQFTLSQLSNYVDYSKPDLLMFDSYDFKGNVIGGSPYNLYSALEKYRQAGLSGNGGNGTPSVPFGTYTQCFTGPFVNDHIVSESEMYLHQFATWAFGGKLVSSFIYTSAPSDLSVKSIIFDLNAWGDNGIQTEKFGQLASLNQQSLNLGSALVRLKNTDVRFLPGQHMNELVSQNLGSSAYSASRYINGFEPYKAFDGVTDNNSYVWHSGAAPPQWLEVNLGEVRSLNLIRLYVCQIPGGTTRHKIYVSNSPIGNNRSGATLVYTFNGTTADYDVLETSLNLTGQYVQIYTDISPSWVVWREVQIYGSANNAIPSEMKVWDNAGRPVTALTSITSDTTSSARNLGTCNSGLRGDVIVGYFKPLHESFDGWGFADQEYFMVVNGLTDSIGDCSQTRQRIRLNFTSPTQIQLLHMRRNNGELETLDTIPNGSNSWYYELDLDGGTGELFKIDTGAPFVGVDDPWEEYLMPGDANRDSIVDVGDLGILAANYGGTGKKWAQGDFNGDGVVDVGDLGILAARYGQGLNGSIDWNTDYARVFGTRAADQENISDEIADLVCSALGLPLIAGLLWISLLFGNGKAEE